VRVEPRQQDALEYDAAWLHHRRRARGRHEHRTRPGHLRGRAEGGRVGPFPGEIAAWDVEKNLSSAKLIAYHAEWTVLSDGAADQILNIADGSMFTCGKFWPVLAKQYGIAYGIPEVDELKLQTIQMLIAPPPRGLD